MRKASTTKPKSTKAQLEVQVAKLERTVARLKEQVKDLKQMASMPVSVANKTTKLPAKLERGRPASASVAPASRRGRKPKIAAQSDVAAAPLNPEREHDDA